MNPADTVNNLQNFLALLDPALNLGAMLTGVARQLVEMFAVDHSAMLSFGEEDPTGKVIAEYPAQSALGLRVPLTNYPLFDRLKTEQTPQAVFEAQIDPVMGPARAAMQTLGIQSIMIIPLAVQGKIVGSLSLDAYQPRRFTRQELDLCQIIGRQIAVALDYTRALERAEANRRQAQTLADINHILSGSLNLDQILPLILEQAHKVLPVDSGNIFLLVDGGLQLKACTGQNQPFAWDEIIPLDHLWSAAQVVRTRRPYLIPDTTTTPHWRAIPNNPNNSWLGAPLMARGLVVGLLNLYGYTPGQFNESHLEPAQAFADQAAIAIDNARLFGEAERRANTEAHRVEQWQRVQQITSALNASLNLDEVLNTACEQFVQLVGVDHCGVVLVDSNGLTGQVVAEYPPGGAAGLTIPLDFPAFRQIQANHQPVASYNALTDPRFGPAVAALQAVGVQSVLIAPLVAQGRVIGSIGLDAIAAPRRFSAEEVNMTRVVADQMAIAITNARAFEAEHAARVQADTLRQAAAALNESLDLSTVLERILAQLQRVIICDSASIILREQDKFRIVAGWGFPAPAQVIGLTFAIANRPHIQEIVRTRNPLVLADTQAYGWQQTGPTAIKSWIGAPLIVGEQLIGLLAVDHSEPNFYAGTDGALVKTFADLAAIALENARLYEFEVKQIEQELEIARNIQRGFFPAQIPALPGWRIAAVCLPARETGGDFYEFVERADGSLGVIVGDVSGKSIPAAMLMAAAQSLVTAKGTDHASPARVMAEANRLLYKDVPIGAFVALSYALFTPHSGEVCLSNGGQLDPLWVPAAPVEPVRLVDTPGERLPLGVITPVEYQEIALTAAPNDLLIFYTDGLVERKNRAGALFGFERLAAVMETVRGISPKEALSTLLTAADAFAQGINPHDDITIVAIQRSQE